MTAPPAAETARALTLGDLQAAVRSGAAFRCRRRLQPGGGEGDKVFPPTFMGAVYAVEQRRVPGREQPVTCVLLDSVQSQANRMEQALQDALDVGEIELPVVEVLGLYRKRSGVMRHGQGAMPDAGPFSIERLEVSRLEARRYAF